LIQLILFLSVGALLLVSLLLFARRGPGAEGASEVLVEARQALRTLQHGVLPPVIVARIFAGEDLAFVQRNAPRAVQQVFSRERTGIALEWVRHLRSQVLSLQRFHRGTARFYSRLSMRTEIELAFDFMALLVACRALQAMLYLRGPHAAPRMVEATTAAAARICAVSEKTLAFLTPPGLAAFDKRSIGPAV
jgi:hypothetical protein